MTKNTPRPIPEKYVLHLRAIPWDRDTRPPVVRLRMALKALLRSYGLRCEMIDYPKADSNAAAEQANLPGEVGIENLGGDDQDETEQNPIPKRYA